MLENFYCESCNYKCCKKTLWTQHITTRKHKNATCSIIDATKKYSYKCECGKIFKHHSSLYRHKNNCKKIEKEDHKIEDEQEQTNNSQLVIIEKPIEHNAIFDIVKQITESNESILKSQINETSKHSLELQKDMFSQIIELLKTNLSTTNNINNGQIQNNNHNHNHTHFNLQIYLNETCKNAMTINQFLDYLEPTVEELEATAHLGYVEGISRIIMRGFKNLEEHELPFHCTDLKREHIYLKNPDDEWVEEKDEKPLLLRFIKEVAKKSFKNLSAWQKKNPNWANYNSKQNDLFNKIVGNSVSGATEEEQQANYEKIMKNIMKHTVIDKSKKNC